MRPRHETLPSLREVDRVAAMVNGDDLDRVNAVRQRVLDELELLRTDARVALDHSDPFDDMRPALLAYVSATARLHGRSHARQLAVFLADRDPLFAELLFRSTGIAP